MKRKMTKNIMAGLLALWLFAPMAQAQAPAMFNYQGAARDSDGRPLAGKTISLQISIHEGEEAGPAVYSETRRITTSTLGLYAIQIGSAGAGSKAGNITDIDWGKGAKYMRISIDPDGGNNFRQAGNSQLLSVPYALYAQQAGDSKENGSKNSWHSVEKNQPATTNEQDIYQSGKVGIMTREPLAPLDVRGAARFGNPVAGEAIGSNSVAFGDLSSASGNNAAAFGNGNHASGANAAVFGLANTASGTYSTAFGTTNTASGSRSTVFGTMSEVSGAYSTSFGSLNKVAGYMSMAIGGNLRAAGNFQIVGGTNNSLTDPERTLFQLGNGNPDIPSELSNALTVMKDGKMAVGTSTAVPLSTLQVFGSLALPIRPILDESPGVGDFTLLVRSLLQMSAASESKGRIYMLVNDSEEMQLVGGSFRERGKQVKGLVLEDVKGKGSAMVQSDGRDWVVIGRF